MQLVDTHVHINFEAFQQDLDEVAQRWRKANVAYLVHSCVDPSEFKGIQAIANRFPEVFFAVGLHPLDVEGKWTDQTADEIFQLANSDRRVVAIGETGLDFFKARNSERQLEALNEQLAIAQRLDLPVIIHCRDAAKAMASHFRNFWEQHGSVRGVMHCWGGTPEETQWFLDLGFFISFSGTVTFKKATQIHESAQMVPCDRLLVETDCPFLAPTPHRGKRNEPANVQYIADRVATLRDLPIEQLVAQTTSNARHLFRLPPLAASGN